MNESRLYALITLITSPLENLHYRKSPLRLFDLELHEESMNVDLTISQMEYKLRWESGFLGGCLASTHSS